MGNLLVTLDPNSQPVTLRCADGTEIVLKSWNKDGHRLVRISAPKSVQIINPNNKKNPQGLQRDDDSGGSGPKNGAPRPKV